MTEPTITCPNCQTDIRLTKSLAAPLIQATRKQFERVIAQKDRDIASREQAIRDQQTALDKDKAAIDQHIAEQVAAERTRIAEEEMAKARRLRCSGYRHRVAAKKLHPLDAHTRQSTGSRSLLTRHGDRCSQQAAVAACGSGKSCGPITDMVPPSTKSASFLWVFPNRRPPNSNRANT